MQGTQADEKSWKMPAKNNNIYLKHRSVLSRPHIDFLPLTSAASNSVLNEDDVTLRGRPKVSREVEIFKGPCGAVWKLLKVEDV